MEYVAPQAGEMHFWQAIVVAEIVVPSLENMPNLSATPL
jgi:hypothetical protein